MRQCWINSLILSLMATGCGDTTGPGRAFDLVVATDKSEYSVRDDSLARVSLANRSTRSVYLPMGIYVVYERLRDGEWQDAVAWFIVDGLGPSFRVEPGATVADELQVRSYLGDRPGTYRFRYFVYADPKLRFPLPTDARVSQPIVLAD